MPSRRMIDPAIWQSESIASLPRLTRLFFIGVFSNADDQGRMKAHPALLRSKIYPYDDVPLDEIAADLATLEAGDFIILYENGGRRFLQIKNWWRYQRPRWAWPSEHPAPEGWEDRVHYRQGNSVVKDNWDAAINSDDLPDDTEDVPPPPADGAPVEPPRNHGGTTAEPAPSGSISGSISTSGRKRNYPGADAPPTSTAYQEIRQAWQELFPAKPLPRASNRKIAGKAATRMNDSHFKQNWRAALERASKSAFCKDGNWFDLEWFLTNDSNYEKCLNGKYDDQNGNSRAPAPPRLKEVQRATT